MEYPRYGYLLLHGLLKREGLVKNKKRTYRLYTEQGLQVRTKKRKKLTRPRVVMDAPQCVFRSIRTAIPASFGQAFRCRPDKLILTSHD
ncbi:HTH-like domain-containing protein, partial [Idiomarina zobellii]